MLNWKDCKNTNTEIFIVYCKLYEVCSTWEHFLNKIGHVLCTTQPWLAVRGRGRECFTLSQIFFNSFVLIVGQRQVLPKFLDNDWRESWTAFVIHVSDRSWLWENRTRTIVVIVRARICWKESITVMYQMLHRDTSKHFDTSGATTVTRRVFVWSEVNLFTTWCLKKTKRAFWWTIFNLD